MSARLMSFLFLCLAWQRSVVARIPRLFKRPRKRRATMGQPMSPWETAGILGAVLRAHGKTIGAVMLRTSMLAPMIFGLTTTVAVCAGIIPGS